MNDSLMFQRLFSLLGGANGWHSTIYIAGMFAALLWRKESVVSWGLFRASYWLFAASLVLPPVVQPYLMHTAMVSNRGISIEGVNTLLNVIWAGIGPIMFAGAVICGLGSMMPLRAVSTPPSTLPPQPPHPLD
ncbi:MAG: hypothetical protein IT427_13300 [Pirellulales bacterium]|nr:hypothetical protein [Pirellulales bacterium]